MVEIASLPLSAGRDAGWENDPGCFFRDAGSGYGCIPVPFYPFGARSFDASGAIWSTARGDPAHRIRKWTPGGDTILVVVTERLPLPVTEAERDSVIDDVRAEL